MNTPKTKPNMFRWLGALIMPAAALVGIAAYYYTSLKAEYCATQRAAAPKLAQLAQHMREHGEAPHTISWEDTPRPEEWACTLRYEPSPDHKGYTMILYDTSLDGNYLATYDSATGRWDKDWCAGR